MFYVGRCKPQQWSGDGSKLERSHRGRERRYARRGGNHYFPADSIRAEFFVDSDTHSTFPWKGEASAKTIRVDGQENPDAAW
jgi:uncharacterized protein (DUF427 family)